jgi:hypothetical protein
MTGIAEVVMRADEDFIDVMRLVCIDWNDQIRSGPRAVSSLLCKL